MSSVPNMDNFTREQAQQFSQMKDLDEFMAYARQEGIDLTDEQLEAVSGGIDYEDYANAAAQACQH